MRISTYPSPFRTNSAAVRVLPLKRPLRATCSASSDFLEGVDPILHHRKYDEDASLKPVRHRLADLPGAIRRRASWAVRDRFPNRQVVRDVQGVRLMLPWSHRLPDYAVSGSAYGQNLVQLAAELADAGPLTVLDVGANVGDSAVQILHAAQGRVLCVEGDPAYLKFLHLNTDADPCITVVEALLAVDPSAAPLTAVRSGGTTRFTEGAMANSLPALTCDELRERYPEFARLRLVKSDTDGYDVVLVPIIARAWHDNPPVLFFEYDPQLSRVAGNAPLEVWERLRELGYRRVAVWDNGGRPLGRTDVDEVTVLASILDRPFGKRGHRYWDVAVVHESDAVGGRAVDHLVGGSLADALRMAPQRRRAPSP